MSFDLDLHVIHEANGVIVTGQVTHDGVEVPIDWPVVIVNPPALVPDGLGGFREDPDEAIRLTVLELARAVSEG